MLAQGPVPVEKLREQAAGAGHSWRTMMRAKGALGVAAEKDGMEGGWSWVMREDDADVGTRV